MYNTYFRWGDENSANIADIFQHPNDWSKVFVFGTNVDKFGQKLEEHINSLTNKYTIVVREKKQNAEQLCDDDPNEDTQTVWQTCLAIHREAHTEEYASCELLVKSTNEVRPLINFFSC